MEIAEAVRTWLVWGALTTFGLALVVAATAQEIQRAWTRSRPFSRIVFLVGVMGITLYGGSKGTISFPFTDVEQRYLIDAGSYVSNDTVRVAFTTVGVPNTAPLLIDYRDQAYTNDETWICYTNTTIRNFNQPQIIAFPNATNYNWLVYTTWTPGSAVVTNGVWHAYWGLDRKVHTEFIPARTCIRVNGEVIATPESKRKWEEAQQEEDDED